MLAFPSRVFRAKISWVAPALDANTHRLSVYAAVDNPDGALKSGMFANFSIITGDGETAPTVLQSAIEKVVTSGALFIDRAAKSD